MLTNPPAPARRRQDPFALLSVFVLFNIALFVNLDPTVAQWIVVPLLLLQARSLAHCLVAARFVHASPRMRLPNTLRFAIMKRDRYRCKLCGRPASKGVVLEVDHKVPVARGGTNNPSNLWTLCDICNSGKSDTLL